MTWKKKVPMLMWLTAGVICAFACGCSSPEDKAHELYETALFEEKQFNYEHAKDLYFKILSEYSETETAQKADQGLKRLELKKEQAKIVYEHIIKTKPMTQEAADAQEALKQLELAE